MSRRSSSSDEEDVSQPQYSTQDTEYGESDVTHTSLLCRQDHYLDRFQQRYSSQDVGDTSHFQTFFNQEYNSSQEHQSRTELPGGVFYSLHPSLDEGASSRFEPQEQHPFVEEELAFSDLPSDLYASYRGEDDGELSLGSRPLAQQHEGHIGGEYDLHPSLLGRYDNGFSPLEPYQNRNVSGARSEGYNSCTDETLRKTVDQRQYEAHVQDESDDEACAQRSVVTESSEESSESGSYEVEFGHISSFYCSMPENHPPLPVHSYVIPGDSDVMPVDSDVIPVDSDVQVETTSHVVQKTSTYTSTGYQTASAEECGVEAREALQTVVKSDDRQARLHSESTLDQGNADHLLPPTTTINTHELVRQLSSRGGQEQPVETSEDEDRPSD